MSCSGYHGDLQKWWASFDYHGGLLDLLSLPPGKTVVTVKPFAPVHCTHALTMVTVTTNVYEYKSLNYNSYCSQLDIVLLLKGSLSVLMKKEIAQLPAGV